MHGVERRAVIDQLREWGFWLRSAQSPKQSFVMSAIDSPLSKKRIVKPIYRSESAENLDLIMSFHMEKEEIIVLELYYMSKLPNLSSAAALGCCVRTFTAKRREAESTLTGVLRAINCQQVRKIA